MFLLSIRCFMATQRRRLLTSVWLFNSSSPLQDSSCDQCRSLSVFSLKSVSVFSLFALIVILIFIYQPFFSRICFSLFLHQFLFRAMHHHNGSPSLCTFNYTGWNTGSLCDCDIIDLLFFQEHWLHQSHLFKINEISRDFCSTSVSGMDLCSLIVGHPFDGCSITYCKSLLSSICPIFNGTNNFCALKPLRDLLPN